MLVAGASAKVYTAVMKVQATWTKAVTAATKLGTKAKIADKAQTAALAAMYAGQWVKQQALSIAGWVRETASWPRTRPPSSPPRPQLRPSPPPSGSGTRP